jgi:hypothetical protein
MKSKIILSLLTLTVLSYSCKDKMYSKFLANSPIYMDYESFRNSVTFESPKSIKEHGSIYTKENHIFIVETGKGIHFINNSNPSAPQKAGFLKILGCTGMAMKGNYLYANSLIDVVVVDVTNLYAPVVVSRVKDLFPDALPASNNSYPYAKIEKDKGVVVGWEVKEVKEETTQQPYGYMDGSLTTFESTSTNGSNSSGTGVSGSITKFTIIQNHLYIMEGHQLFSLGIANPLSITQGTPISIWRVVETLFPHENYIFMGTTTGMLIYSTTNPNQPNYVAEVNHMTACDPVVVKDNYAYVTIREGRNCGGTINQLDIIDISTITNPILKKSYGMNNPNGLGIDQNLLFICDGSAGLKVFDATDPEQAGDNLIKQFGSIKAIDVIPLQNVLLLIAEDGLYQYNYSDPQNITLLSTLLFD